MPNERAAATVYVVLWDNYGDQGVDYLGTFASREAAERRVEQFMIQEPGLHSWEDFRVLEECVRE